MKTIASEPSLAELIRRLNTIQPTTQRRWGRMTAHQMICHIGDCCRMATGEKRVSQASSVLHRTVIKWIALYAPVQWRPGIVTRPEVDQENGGSPPGEFARDLASAKRLLQAIAMRDHHAAWPDHPIFGSMSRRAWLRWAYLHTDHHLRQFGA
jgi:Protein of unknown function (DUF1569)